MKYRTNLLTLAAVLCSLVFAAPASSDIVARWTFDSATEFAAGLISDVSGNGNDLTLVDLPGTVALYRPTFSTETYSTPYPNGGAIHFNGTKIDGNPVGSYFTTAVDAPLNGLEFTAGYTVEALFKIPDFDGAVNKWMGGLTRSGKPSGDPSATFAISNFGEVQWHTQQLSGSEQSLWSDRLTIDDTYHHVAFVNYQDTGGQWHVDMYVDGTLGSRNWSNCGSGIMNYGDNNPWYVGLQLWDNQADNVWNGWIDEIRISDTPLEPGEFLTAVPSGTGDANMDGFVNSLDLDIVRGNWGSTVTPGDASMGDLSGDGMVNSSDLDLIRGNWGNTYAASVPEPAVCTLAAAALMILGFRLRRQ